MMVNSFLMIKKRPQITKISEKFNFENNSNILQNTVTFFYNNNEINGEITKEILDSIIKKIEEHCCSNTLYQDLKKADINHKSPNLL